MANFPRLKTNAVMQYPATRDFRFANSVLRFLDGDEQCYRGWREALRRWMVRLDLLDETEVANLQAFFAAEQGRFGSFAFTDPWDGNEYADCSLDQDSFEFQLMGEMRAQTVLIVRQNRI